MADNTIHLEAFQANLHGLKILCQGPFTKGAFPPVLEAIENIKIPFQRKVLLIGGDASPFAKTFSLKYDATFHIGNTIDWSLALTYILHAPKDVLVVADPHTQSGKARKARRYGTRIIHEPVVWQMLGLDAE